MSNPADTAILTMPSMKALRNNLIMTSQMCPAFTTGVDPRTVKIHHSIIFSSSILGKLVTGRILQLLLRFTFLFLALSWPTGTPLHNSENWRTQVKGTVVISGT